MIGDVEMDSLVTAHRQMSGTTTPPLVLSCAEKVAWGEAERKRRVGLGLGRFALLVGRSEMDKGVRPTVSLGT